MSYELSVVPYIENLESILVKHTDLSQFKNTKRFFHYNLYNFNAMIVNSPHKLQIGKIMMFL